MLSFSLRSFRSRFINLVSVFFSAAACLVSNYKRLTFSYLLTVFKYTSVILPPTGVFTPMLPFIGSSSPTTVTTSSILNRDAAVIVPTPSVTTIIVKLCAHTGVCRSTRDLFF